jgi:uncharacterized protein YdcH (DUF465 family)
MHSRREITHRAWFRMTRRGDLTWEDLPMTEHNAQEDLKAHLIATNEEYRRLLDQHSDFARKLDALESLPHLTEEEQIEEVRLKKLKLRLKDQMEAIVNQNRVQHVA